MKITQTWKRTSDTTITLTTVYTSENKEDIDALEAGLSPGTLEMDGDYNPVGGNE